MNEIYTKVISGLVGFGIDLLWALIVLVVGMKLARILSKKFSASRLLKRIDPSVATRRF